MLEQMAKDADEPDIDSVETDLFGVLFGFHQRVSDLLRQSSMDKDELKVVGERIKLVIQNVTNDMKHSQGLDSDGKVGVGLRGNTTSCRGNVFQKAVKSC